MVARGRLLIGLRRRFAWLAVGRSEAGVNFFVACCDLKAVMDYSGSKALRISIFDFLPS